MYIICRDCKTVLELTTNSIIICTCGRKFTQTVNRQPLVGPLPQRKKRFKSGPPKPKPQIPYGAGTELKALLKALDILPGDCLCNLHADKMNVKGIDWCKNNKPTIIGWMETEANKQGLLFTKRGAALLVRIAIRNAEYNIKWNLSPSPENLDHDLLRTSLSLLSPLIKLLKTNSTSPKRDLRDTPRSVSQTSSS